MARDIRAVIVAHPARTFLIVSPLLTLFALSTTPRFIPVVALVTTLRLWSWVALPNSDHRASQVAQVVLISLAAGMTQLPPSLNALSTPTTSLVVLSLLSVITSSIASTAFVVSHYAVRMFNTPFSRLAVFPALWATTWGFISRVSPLGHLATWSPVLGLGAYDWTRGIFGQWGIDWITAAWATVCSEVLGDWLVAVDQQDLDHEHEVDVQDRITISTTNRERVDINARENKSISRSRSLWCLTTVLLVLTVPSYILPSLPTPPQSSGTTPFTVGCALPAARSTGIATLQDYIYETKTIQALAPIVLWPESAVRFNSAEEKDDAFSRIQNMPLGRGRYVGVSFEDFTAARRENGIYYPPMKRNGFALLGSTGPPVMEYYKRNLVPIAESFSLTPGTEDPLIYTIDLRSPKSYNKTDWAPAPNFTRPIPITASICLDFASPSSFAHLPSRPALILAPARTWHSGIGHAMWEQAKDRAKETGSAVVWCDGGPGGVSGVASQGHEEILQVGQGSWTMTVGLQWPFDDRRTPFLWGGPYMAFVAIWSVLGAGWVMELVSRRGMGMSLLRKLFFSCYSRKSDEERPLLHE